MQREYWYHGVKHGQQTALIAGPFATREEADAIHWQAVEATQKIDASTWMMDWFTCRLPDGTRRGGLNKELGISPLPNECR